MDIVYRITRRYKKIKNSIAFLPAVISSGIFLLSLLINALENTTTGKDILISVKFIQFNNPDTVRSLLSALLTGIFSLTVFSFTMVMVVVNQSASNYSPKVIGEFINKTINQVILGIYIGTILYFIVTLTQIGDPENFSKIPHFNVFISIILIAVCIALFIVFIENISRSVRINNVIERIFKQTKEALKKSTGNSAREQPGTDEWYPYKAKNSGYFQYISSGRLLGILKDKELVLRVKPFYGTYLIQDHILFYLNKKIHDRDLLNRIESTFITYSGENIHENYFYGFRQLREVAVKALSPGINDPGIAVICLDYLSELLAQYISFEKKVCLEDEDGDVRVFFKRHSFAELFNLTVIPIMTYGKRDFLILSHILLVLGNISLADEKREFRDTLLKNARFIVETVKENIKSKPEMEYINDVIKILCESGYFVLDTII